MNNLYFIRKDDQRPQVDKVEMDGDRYDPPVIEKQRLRGLADPVTKRSGERRSHKRFHINKNAFALIRSISAGPLKIVGKSMGSIACDVFNAKPAKLGTIDNISKGGLTFQYIENIIQLNNAFVLDILVADCGFYLAGIPFTIITDFLIPGDVFDDSVEMRQVRLQFQRLAANQEVKLKDFILNHGSENGAIGIKDQITFSRH